MVRLKMTKQEMIERKKKLEGLIEMLKSDINCFGACSEDIERITMYKRELEEINNNLT